MGNKIKLLEELISWPAQQLEEHAPLRMYHRSDRPAQEAQEIIYAGNQETKSLSKSNYGQQRLEGTTSL